MIFIVIQTNLLRLPLFICNIMNHRLLKIIKYKTSGKQNEFADLMGWSPQYLTKLLKGTNFGISPVVSILKRFPDIDARWFLLGEGSMISPAGRIELKEELNNTVIQLLDMEKYIPFMTVEELSDYSQAIISGSAPCYSPDVVAKWAERLTTRQKEITEKSCKQKKVKK